jgi:peptidoglycan/xylan/chitin deacetylase (PgdA/CDA1 family)
MFGRPLKLLQRAFTRVTGEISYVATREPVVALTFDDGPNPDATPQLLEILARHGAKATFFMTGENAAACPELVGNVLDAGHAIGNHTWDHPSLPLVTGRERRRQIRECAKVLPDGGDRLFRAPYGNLSPAALWDVWRCGHRLIGWSSIITDWEPLDAATLARQALDAIRPGAIMVMHDGLVDFISADALDRQPTLDAVAILLAEMADRYRFVTVPELLRTGRPIHNQECMAPDPAMLNQLQRRRGTPYRYPMAVA